MPAALRCKLLEYTDRSFCVVVLCKDSVLRRKFLLTHILALRVALHALARARRLLPLGLWRPLLAALVLAACSATGPERPASGDGSAPTATAAPTPIVLAPGAASPTDPAPISTPAPTPSPSPTPDFTNLPYATRIWEVRRGDPDARAVALTFDAGSTATFTPPMLETLRRHGVRVTIFITGEFADRYPELVKEMIADGHEIGNHSYAHPDFTTLEDDAIRSEIRRTEEAVKRVGGVSTKPWFRPPYGARNPHVLDLVVREGYWSIYWTIDTIDWREDATPALIRQRIRERLQNGAIILAHLGSHHTMEALPDILTDLKQEGYRIVKVSELLRPPKSPKPPPPPIVIEPTPTVVLSRP